MLYADKPTFALSVRLLRILNVLIREFYSCLVRGEGRERGKGRNGGGRGGLEEGRMEGRRKGEGGRG